MTDNIGNCLFESLSSLGLGDNDIGKNPNNLLRNNIFAILLLVKDEETFFPN